MSDFLNLKILSFKETFELKEVIEFLNKNLLENYKSKNQNVSFRWKIVKPESDSVKKIDFR
jgi:hypothetical protein